MTTTIFHQNKSIYARMQTSAGGDLTATAGGKLNVISDARADFAVNANLQVAGTDLLTDVGGGLVVGSATHDNFNVNANLQIANTDLAFGQAAKAASIPVTIASDQGSFVQPVGVEANAWNAAVVSADGFSTSIDCQYVSILSIFGNTNAATTILLEQGQDNVAWYDTGLEFSVGGTGGDFYMTLNDAGARYYRLQSTGAATITATIAGKQ